MKFKYIKLIFTCSLLGALASCTLNYEPLSAYTELTNGTTNDSTTVVLKDRAAALSQRQVLYQLLRSRQENWYNDLELIAEAHSDNAYVGTTGAEIVPFETNSLDASNPDLERDWNRYLEDIAQANVLISGLDPLQKSGNITEAECNQWKAEGKIFRALVLFEMCRIWGSVPLITTTAQTITSSNIKEVYPVYYPAKSTTEECYTQIVKDLTEALSYAPDLSSTDKTLLSKTVAQAMLAKVYAEKPLRDYSKVIQYADLVKSTTGLTLENDYSNLFGYDTTTNDCKKRNTTEGILEIQYTTGDANWASWMFGRDLTSYDFYFTWAKWITPSRDLIKAFDDEGDSIRKNQSIIYYTTTWSNYYPSSHYPFMYKLRSGVNSIIKIRLADIMLLEAEAYVNQNNLSAAATLVNKIRERVKLSDLSSSITSSQSSMADAVLKERRLELAFENQRWFDLCRNNKVESTMNAVYAKDSGRLTQKRTFDSNSYLLPIPQTALDKNTNLTQNPGY
jgi:hypothetical protein